MGRIAELENIVAGFTALEDMEHNATVLNINTSALRGLSSGNLQAVVATGAGAIGSLVFGGLEVIGGLSVAALTIGEDIATVGAGIADDPFTLSIAGALLIDGVEGYVDTVSEIPNNYYEHVEYYNYMDAYRLYPDLPPELQCEFLQKTYDVYSTLSGGLELVNDVAQRDVKEFGEDLIIAEAEAILDAAGYNMNTGDACADLIFGAGNDFVIDAEEGIDDE